MQITDILLRHKPPDVATSAPVSYYRVVPVSPVRD